MSLTLMISASQRQMRIYFVIISFILFCYFCWKEKRGCPLSELRLLITFRLLFSYPWLTIGGRIEWSGAPADGQVSLSSRFFPNAAALASTLHWFLLNNHFHWPTTMQQVTNWRWFPLATLSQKCCSNHSHSGGHFPFNRSKCLHSAENSREISQMPPLMRCCF